MAEPLSRRRRRAPAARAALAVACVLASGCAGKTPPSADGPPPAAPNLAGLSVMVLPVQSTGAGTPDAIDAEIAYWLADHAPRVKWIFPARLEAALARNPSLDVRIDALAVAGFLRSEVQWIGDPLYGDLRRLGALLDARYALLPVAAGYVAREGGGGRIELLASLVDTFGGRVLWIGVVGGRDGPPDDPAVVASAAQALAQALVH